VTKFNDILALIKGLLNPQLLESGRDHAVARMIGLLGSEETKTNRSAAPNVAVSEFRVSVISFGRLSYLPLNSQACKFASSETVSLHFLPSPITTAPLLINLIEITVHGSPSPTASTVVYD